MSALANVVEFRLPKRKPKIIEKAAPPDQRTVSVLPIRALVDKELTDGSFRVLAVLCSYTNRAGITWVSQKRLSEDMKVSRQAITKHMVKLRALGYVEITRKGFKGEKPNTLRVIFDLNITAQDAIAITSGQEDTRPPEIIRDEQRAAQKAQEATNERMADDGLPEMSPEQAEANKVRLRELLSNWSNPNFKTHQPQKIGDIVTKKKPAHRQPQEVANEEASNRQPTPVDNSVNKSLHRQPHRQPNRVAQKTREHLEELPIVKELNNRLTIVLGNQELKLIATMLECMSESEALVALDQVQARYAAEGLKLPQVPMLVNDMIMTHSARYLEEPPRA